MAIKMRNGATAIVALAVALLLTTVSTAQNFPDRDAKEVSSYVLSEAALAKYTRAVANLQPLMKSMAQSCDDDESAGSLSAMAARMDAVAGVKAAIQSAGMTTREYLVFSFSVFQNGLAAWALAQPGGKLPAGVQMANVSFYRAHEAAFKQLGDKTKAADCDGGDEEDGDESER
jgi:hypothetical protein